MFEFGFGFFEVFGPYSKHGNPEIILLAMEWSESQGAILVSLNTGNFGLLLKIIVQCAVFEKSLPIIWSL